MKVILEGFEIISPWWEIQCRQTTQNFCMGQASHAIPYYFIIGYCLGYSFAKWTGYYGGALYWSVCLYIIGIGLSNLDCRVKLDYTHLVIHAIRHLC